MAILRAGEFRVSAFRKDIPESTKKAVRKRYRYDHRPALQDRDYDTEAGDFIPPQHDPACIDLIEDGQHDFRTFGRAPGAEQTVTTRGSDSHNRKHRRNVRDSEAIHRAKLAAKEGDDAAEAEHLASVSKKSRLRAKPRIQSAGFRQGHRPLRSRNDLRKRREPAHHDAQAPNDTPSTTPGEA